MLLAALRPSLKGDEEPGRVLSAAVPDFNVKEHESQNRWNLV
jgi:hypothetical protein